jgi:hypothetical protein
MMAYVVNPSLANKREVSNPIQLELPVTTATFPYSICLNPVMIYWKIVF